MLTLTRRAGERIAIGDRVEITVVEIGRGKVRIGISAPRDMPIHRGEVLDRIVEENRRALAPRPLARGEDRGAVEPPASHPLALVFDEGLPGLRDHRRFLLVDLPDHGAVRALVSCLDDMVQLLVVDALDLAVDYPVARAREAARLEDAEVAVALVVTLPASGGVPTVNLLAPIVVGLESRRGVQVILEGMDLPTRCPLGAAEAPATEVVIEEAAP